MNVDRFGNPHAPNLSYARGKILRSTDLSAAKVGRLVFMLSCPQSFGGLALLLTRALSIFHGGMHLRLQVARTHRDVRWTPIVGQLEPSPKV